MSLTNLQIAMKKLALIVSLAILATSCGENEKSDPAAEAFEKNSETVLANLQGWQAENIDYSMYADDFYMLTTAFGSEKDSVTLDEMKEMDAWYWQTHDFEMLNEPVLLIGVDPSTNTPDGSVRHYSQWKVTKSATDSTEAKSGEIQLYEFFTFNEEGKILRQGVYGDFGGLQAYLDQ